MNTEARVSAFNSPLEAGIRSVTILLRAHPNAYDLQRIVTFDHLVVHTGDVGGPHSLHPQLPLRETEILVRRHLVERGLLLMMSRGLVERVVGSTGISYRASELAQILLTTMTSPYISNLIRRSDWVVDSFGDLDDETLRREIDSVFGKWIEEFGAINRSMEASEL